MRAFSGSLASLELLDAIGRQAPASAAARSVVATAVARLGPASSARHVFDILAAPLLARPGATLSLVEGTPTAVAAAVSYGTAVRRWSPLPPADGTPISGGSVIRRRVISLEPDGGSAPTR